MDETRFETTDVDEILNTLQDFDGDRRVEVASHGEHREFLMQKGSFVNISRQSAGRLIEPALREKGRITVKYPSGEYTEFVLRQGTMRRLPRQSTHSL
ncbi:hypothetical protein RCL1_004175 [Eukaryota sp. TZLM3-RCL]